jgi:hypothetical protein
MVVGQQECWFTMLAFEIEPPTAIPEVEFNQVGSTLLLMAHRGMHLVRDRLTGHYTLCPANNLDPLQSKTRASTSAVEQLRRQGWLAPIEEAPPLGLDVFYLTAEGWRAGRESRREPQRAGPRAPTNEPRS